MEVSNGLIEPIAILDTFATGMAKIEDLGNGMRRLVFYAPHPVQGGVIEKHVVAKLVLPAVCLLQISEQINEGAVEAVGTMMTLVPQQRERERS